MIQANDDYYTIAMNTTLDFKVAPSLTSNDILGCSGVYHTDIVGQPQHGTADTANSGWLVYAPEPGFTGIDTFTYTLTHPDTQTVDLAIATITVTPGCTVVAWYDGYWTPFDQPVSDPAPGVLDNDVLGCPPLTPVLAGPPLHGTAQLAPDGSFQYTPDPGYAGWDDVGYHLMTATDTIAASGAISVHVAEADDCVLYDDNYSTPMDTPLVTAAPGVRINEVFCDELDSLALNLAPQHGTVTLDDDGSFVYTPDPGFVGEDSFVYDAYFWGSDVAEYSPNEATVTIMVIDPTDITDTTDPGPGTTEPGPDTTAPGTDTTEPGPDTTDPGTATTDPVSESTSPGSDTSDPASDATDPEMEQATEPIGPVTSGDNGSAPQDGTASRPPILRIAAYDVALSRDSEGELLADLSVPGDEQAAHVAAILQQNRPDVVVLCDVDYDADGAAVDAFLANYLAVPQAGLQPMDYPYAFVAPSNGGVPSGFDLDNDGSVGGSGDAWGRGDFPGQHGMVVLSRFPILDADVRTFQRLLWSSVPGARLPDNPATPDPADWYDAAELATLPLSSTAHWDVPIDVEGRIVHVLASRPTPPDGDGPEDRNGLRNADEIAFWADYVAGTDTSWIVDDGGTAGGLDPTAAFVIVGALGSDPADGDAVAGAVDQLIALGNVNDPTPRSDGAVEASALQAAANLIHGGDPATDTADLDDGQLGNLRLDYVLPSAGLEVRRAEVFWPAIGDPLFDLLAIAPPTTTPHRLVWVDIA